MTSQNLELFSSTEAQCLEELQSSASDSSLEHKLRCCLLLDEDQGNAKPEHDASTTATKKKNPWQSVLNSGDANVTPLSEAELEKEDIKHEATVNVLDSLARLLPAFWMTGRAKEALQIASEMGVFSQEDLCAAEKNWAGPVPRAGGARENSELICWGLLSSSLPDVESKMPTRQILTEADAGALMSFPSSSSISYSSVAKTSDPSSSSSRQQKQRRHRIVLLLRAAVFDAFGQNAYACTQYQTAWTLHLAALKQCDSLASYCTGIPSDDELAFHLLIRARALDGIGRVLREAGVLDLAMRCHIAAIRRSSKVFVLMPPSSSPVEEKPAWAFNPPPPLAHVTWCNAISNAGVVAHRQQEFEIARRLHSLALEHRRAVGELRGIASSCGNLALLLLIDVTNADKDDKDGHDEGGKRHKSDTRNNVNEAIQLYLDCKESRLRLGDTWGVAGALRSLSVAYMRLGSAEGRALAKSCLVEAGPIFAKVSDALGITECLETLAHLALQEDATSEDAGGWCRKRAARLLRAASVLRRHQGADPTEVEAALAKIEPERENGHEKEEEEEQVGFDGAATPESLLQFWTKMTL